MAPVRVLVTGSSKGVKELSDCEKLGFGGKVDHIILSRKAIYHGV
jgi:hypothetical protein